MKKNILFLYTLLSISNADLYSYAISTICIDVEAVFQTNALQASKYVGKFDSVRYLTQAGNLPNQEDLFKQLKPIKSISSQVTYNKGLAMPLILSDWLASLQTSTKISTIIQNYLNNKDISNIEKKVLLAIVSMMLIPNHLADTQSVSTKIESLLGTLHRNGYKIYLVGNWANISSLKKNFPNVFKIFKGVHVSGDMHLLKPSTEFYTKILELSGFKSDQILWIETEQKFISKMNHFGYQTILYNHSQHEDIFKNLQKYGVRT